MKLTPLDLQHQTFRRKFHGFDHEQVDAFLALVRAEWEELLRENQAQKENLVRLEEMLAQHQQKERHLQETLMTAQKLSEDVRQNARKEAEIIIGQAELQAEKILHQAHERLTAIIDDIHDAKKARADVEGQLKAILESHLRLLELRRDAGQGNQLEDVGLLPAAS